MSEFLAQVATIEAVESHPGADRLDIAHVFGYPVIVGKGAYRAGDVASYIPVDAVLPSPEVEPEFAVPYKYTSKGRVKATRLRGVVSHGFLHRVPPGFSVGDDIAGYWGIVKHDDSAPAFRGGGARFLPADAVPDPGFLPKYDIENIRRWPAVLGEGEEVVITEKLHGCNARFAYHEGRLWVGSRNLMVRPAGDSVWARVARDYGLADVLADAAGIAVYGEIIGVQDLSYGLSPGQFRLRVFDTYDIRRGDWDDFDEMVAVCRDIGLTPVPMLYRGPFSDAAVAQLTNGKSVLGNHIREGIVIRPVRERRYGALGRVILKSVSDNYLLRKEAA